MDNMVFTTEEIQKFMEIGSWLNQEFINAVGVKLVMIVIQDDVLYLPKHRN